MPWLARGPGFDSIDFYVWGYLDVNVYNNTINTRDELRQKIISATNLIRNETILFDVKTVKRIAKYTGVIGGHFEQLLPRHYHF